MDKFVFELLSKETKSASEWLHNMALPLWADKGFDHSRGIFEEQLDFSLQVQTEQPYRLMVQARQISVYAAAAVTGRYSSGREMALIAAEGMIRRFECADGRPGWVMSINRRDEVSDPTRDLYAHAFALFGLAWASRLDARASFRGAIDRLIEFLDDHMFDPVAGGFWDSLPRRDRLRRQNPHMHLFEACIALYETFGDKAFLQRCQKLHELLVDRFIDHHSGAVREVFSDDWAVAPSEGEGSVEPGHLFEWAWLLGRYEAISGTSDKHRIASLMRMAIVSGLNLNTGRIIDEIREDGTPARRSSRSWPHAEALKALTSIPEGHEIAIAAILHRLNTLYCSPAFLGGWQDHLDENDLPLRDNIPASSLYHLYFGITSAAELLQC